MTKEDIIQSITTLSDDDVEEVVKACGCMLRGRTDRKNKELRDTFVKNGWKYVGGMMFEFKFSDVVNYRPPSIENVKIKISGGTIYIENLGIYNEYHHGIGPHRCKCYDEVINLIDRYKKFLDHPLIEFHSNLRWQFGRDRGNIFVVCCNYSITIRESFEVELNGSWKLTFYDESKPKVWSSLGNNIEATPALIAIGHDSDVVFLHNKVWVKQHKPFRGLNYRNEPDRWAEINIDNHKSFEKQVTDAVFGGRS